MPDYDVYHLWLGISPEEQPPDYYRLLGVPLFEQNADVIRNAADRQLSHVKRLAVNQFTQVGQQLLDEIAAAKICLLRPEKREVYDAKLRASIEKRGAKSKTPTMLQVPLPTEISFEKYRATGIKGSVDAGSEVAEQILIVGRDPS